MTTNTEHEAKEVDNEKEKDEHKTSEMNAEIEIGKEHDPKIDVKLDLEVEKTAKENNKISPRRSPRKKKDRNDLNIDRRLLKSEPATYRKERLNKVRIEFQNRLLMKLSFFNSLRAQELKWGIQKDVYKSRMDTQTADPVKIRASTPVNVFITQDDNIHSQ